MKFTCGFKSLAYERTGEKVTVTCCNEATQLLATWTGGLVCRCEVHRAILVPGRIDLKPITPEEAVVLQVQGS